jgi:hypothetical protein
MIGVAPIVSTVRPSVAPLERASVDAFLITTTATVQYSLVYPTDPAIIF